MPLVNGRYYMNAQYGLGLERARAEDEQQKRLHGEPEPSWLDHFLGLVETDADRARISTLRNHSDGISFESLSGIASRAQNRPPAAQRSKPPADNTTVGNSVQWRAMARSEMLPVAETSRRGRTFGSGFPI